MGAGLPGNLVLGGVDLIMKNKLIKNQFLEKVGWLGISANPTFQNIENYQSSQF